MTSSVHAGVLDVLQAVGSVVEPQPVLGVPPVPLPPFGFVPPLDVPPLAVLPPAEGAPPVPAGVSVPLQAPSKANEPRLANEPNRAECFIVPNPSPERDRPELTVSSGIL